MCHLPTFSTKVNCILTLSRSRLQASFCYSLTFLYNVVIFVKKTGVLMLFLELWRIGKDDHELYYGSYVTLPKTTLFETCSKFSSQEHTRSWWEKMVLTAFKINMLQIQLLEFSIIVISLVSMSSFT